MSDLLNPMSVVPTNIEDELKTSYLAYSMSVIVGRAIPDVRDGLKPVHRRILFTMHEMNNTHTTAYKKSARIVGDCFAAGTLVHTEHGLVPIEEIEVGDKIRMADGALSEVVQTYHNPPGEMLDVTLSNGVSIGVTPDQRFRVLTDDLQIIWVEAKNLAGKRVLVTNPRALGMPEAHPDAQRADLSYLCGLIVAEGTGHSDESPYVRVNMTNEEPLEFLSQYCEQNNISIHQNIIRPKQPHYKPQHHISLKGIPELREICENKSAAKTVPAWILADRRLFASFIAGFTDGDGYIRESSTAREVVLASTSKTLLAQLQIMLADSGIHSNLAVNLLTERPDGANRQQPYALSFTGENASAFCRLVRDYLKIPKKQAAAEKLIQWQGRVLNTETECIPSEAIFGELSKKHLGGGWYLDKEGNKFRAGIKYKTGAKIRYEKDLSEKSLSYRQIQEFGILDKLEKIGSPLFDNLQNIVKNYCVVDVKSINKKPELAENFDIQIAHESHAFIAHGTVISNCMGKYHPHGDSAIYDAMVRMAQEFNMRYMLVDGQGNFGCFTGDTKIKLLDGSERSFAELAQLPSDEVFYVYSVDKSGRVVVGEGRHARITRKEAALVVVALDNGEKIRCTPDHRFLLKNGTYKEAKDLTPEDSLMPGYFNTAPVKEGLNEYLRVFQPATGEYEFVHVIADRFNFENNLAKSFSGAFVRHHKNFNRFDNRPTNLERMTFLEHLHLHASHLEELWKDESFRTAQREGVQRYYNENPKIREDRRARFIEQNQDKDFIARSAQTRSQVLKERFQDPQLREELSARMKALWAEPDYQEKMKKALKGASKRPLSETEKKRVAQIISEKSKAMWTNDEKRAEITAAVVEALTSESIRERLSESAKKSWRDPVYRAKFGKDHFSQMAKTLWSDPSTREMHSAKAKTQWQDPEFQQIQSERAKKVSAKLLLENPKMIEQMTEKAKIALRECWKSPEYKQQVMQQKIITYVSSLVSDFGKDNVTPSLYQSQRKANWIPNCDKALQYFSTFEQMVAVAGKNHRIVSVSSIQETADVYDITVNEHHNFLLASGVFVHNSVDGDAPAAQRYTEVRLDKLSQELLSDIDKETVEFGPNYDDTLQEPLVLPSKLPNLLLNGSEGIAVGMATKIPPHNLTELLNGTITLIDAPETSIDELILIIPGPDFPTAGIIHGLEGIHSAYKTGRGILKMRGKADIETHPKTDRETLIITEIPYQVNKAKLIEKIAELIKEKKIEGITDIRDESNREGMRVVIELKRDIPGAFILNHLYKMTPLESSFGVILLSIVDGRPQVLNLKQILQRFIEHRREVVTRRTVYELRKAEERLHLLLGLLMAVDHIDRVISIIRNSPDTDTARRSLCDEAFTGELGKLQLFAGLAFPQVEEAAKTGIFKMSEIQAKAILELRLNRLTGLERDKVLGEAQEVRETILRLKEILGKEDVLMGVIRKELEDIRDKYGDERRTKIIPAEGEISMEDLINREDMVITVSHAGYIKRSSTSLYRSQRRGGRGKSSMSTKEEDFVSDLFVASTHHHFLIFTDRGRVFSKKVYEIPATSTAAKGKAIVNLIPLEKEEKVAAFMPVAEFKEGTYIVFATKNGVVKKTDLSLFGNIRQSGIIALLIDDGDQLISVRMTSGKQDLFLGTKEGLSIRFAEEELRPLGRAARGVKGISLKDNDRVVGMEALSGENETILTVCENGYGKRTEVSEYRDQHRGGSGVITIKATERNGDVVGFSRVGDDDQIMVVTNRGSLIRTATKEIRICGRNTQGVRIIFNDEEGEKVVGLARLPKEEATAEETAPITPTATLPIPTVNGTSTKPLDPTKN
jgi:DNA gyrase A subunit